MDQSSTKLNAKITGFDHKEPSAQGSMTRSFRAACGTFVPAPRPPVTEEVNGDLILH